MKKTLNIIRNAGYILGYTGIALMAIELAGGAIMSFVKKD